MIKSYFLIHLKTKLPSLTVQNPSNYFNVNYFIEVLY